MQRTASACLRGFVWSSMSSTDHALCSELTSGTNEDSKNDEVAIETVVINYVIICFFCRTIGMVPELQTVPSQVMTLECPPA